MNEERQGRVEQYLLQVSKELAGLKGSTETAMGKLSGEIETLNERLFLGNGGESLVVRVDRIEQSQERVDRLEQWAATRRWHVRHLWTAIAAVVATVVAGWIFGGGN